MSDIGLYSGLYDAIRRWANLIDDVLAALKSGNDLSAHRSYLELMKLVSGLASQDVKAVDFSDRRVANIVAIELGGKLSWIELEAILRDGSRSAEVVHVLEAIAQCLAVEHASTVAKMRWGRS